MRTYSFAQFLLRAKSLPTLKEVWVGLKRRSEAHLSSDDDVQFRASLAAVLSARGCRVLEAGSGEAATLLLDDENPDLLIVDGLLLDLSGAEWIESVRQRDADTTIVFLSAYWRDLEHFSD